MTADGAPIAEAPGLQPPDAGGDAVPAWLRTLAAISWRVLATIVLALVFLRIALLLSTVTASLLVAFIVAAAFAPIDQALRTRGWSRTKAASATSVVVLAGVLAVVGLLVAAFVPTTLELIHLGELGTDDLAAQLQSLGVPADAVDFLTRLISGFESWITATIGALLSSAGDLTTVVILGGFMTFFAFVDGDRAWGDDVRALAGDHYDDLTDRAWIALQRVGGYLRGTFVMASIDAVAMLVFLLVLNVPLAGPLAVIMFLGGFVPYLGGVFTVGLILIVANGVYGPGTAAVLLALVVVVSVLEMRFVAPRVYGSAPRIPAALVLVVLPAGATLFGLLGLIVAVPVVAAVITLAPVVIDMLDGDAPPNRPAGLVPVWLDRLGQWSWRALAIIATLSVIILGILQVPIVTLPAILAGVLAATLRPAMAALRRRGAGATAGALVATAGSAIVVAAVVAITVVSMASSFQSIVDQAVAGAEASGVGAALPDLVERLGAIGQADLQAVLGQVAGIGIIVLMIMLLTFYLLRDGSTWWRLILGRVPPDRRASVDSIGTRTADVLSGYMIGTGSIAVFAGVTQWLMMALLGLPLAVPIGVLTFFLSFIPYIGDLVATALGFLVAIAVGSPLDIALMGVFTIVINILQGNIIAPIVYRRTVNIHPALALLAAPAGSAIGGLMGMFLAVPFIGIVVATWRTVIRLFDPAGMPPAAETTAPPERAPADAGVADGGSVAPEPTT